MRQNKEKYFNETIAYRNRNPLNIRYSKNVKWQGQVGEEKGFVKFLDFQWGYRAAVKILRSYHLRGIRSIRDIISTWAPRNENDTNSYIKNVVRFMNGAWRIDKDEGDYCPRTQINLRDREMVLQLLYAMTRVEMSANAAQSHSLRGDAEWGYDKAVTTPGFFKEIKDER